MYKVANVFRTMILRIIYVYYDLIANVYSFNERCVDITPDHLYCDKEHAACWESPRSPETGPGWSSETLFPVYVGVGCAWGRKRVRRRTLKRSYLHSVGVGFQ